MNVETAKNILNQCERHELRDHAFGDMEVSWTKDGNEVGAGYFGGGVADVSLIGEFSDFHDEDARALQSCGTLAHVERNDSTGPEEFVEGQTMPGLTKEGVREELQHKNVFDKS